MPTKQINGIEMSYEIDRPATSVAQGPPLVLLHGFPLDPRAWQEVAEFTALNRLTVRPALRDFGHSHEFADADSPAFTVELLADDVHALLTELKLLPCVLGGLSMGGYVALAFARKYAADLRGLALVDTKAAADTPEARQGREEMIALVRREGTPAVVAQMLPKMTGPGVTPAARERLRRIMLDQSADGIALACMAMRDRPDFTGDLPKLNVPTAVVVGEQDAITPPELARSMADALPDCKLTVVPNAGHMAPLEQPFAAAVALKGLLARAGSAQF